MVSPTRGLERGEGPTERSGFTRTYQPGPPVGQSNRRPSPGRLPIGFCPARRFGFGVPEVLLSTLAGLPWRSRCTSDGFYPSLVLFALDPRHTGMDELREIAGTGAELGGSSVPPSVENGWSGGGGGGGAMSFLWARDLEYGVES